MFDFHFCSHSCPFGPENHAKWAWKSTKTRGECQTFEKMSAFYKIIWFQKYYIFVFCVWFRCDKFVRMWVFMWFCQSTTSDLKGKIVFLCILSPHQLPHSSVILHMYTLKIKKIQLFCVRSQVWIWINVDFSLKKASFGKLSKRSKNVKTFGKMKSHAQTQLSIWFFL